MELDEQEQNILKEIQSQNQSFKFLGDQITSQQISSMLPFFDCEETGHSGNMMDQVCLDQDCSYKGLCCVRCSYQKHRNHPNSVYPLHTFVGQLITQSQQRGLVLDEQINQSSKLRDVVNSQLKTFVDSIIEYISEFKSNLLRYHQQFYQQYQNTIIKSQILVHSLIYKKHIRKDKFQKYIKESVRCIQLSRAQSLYRPSSDYYTITEPRTLTLQDKLLQEVGGISISDQERAFQLTNHYIEDLQKITIKIENLIQKILVDLNDNGRLKNISEQCSDYDFDNNKNNNNNNNNNNYYDNNKNIKTRSKQFIDLNEIEKRVQGENQRQRYDDDILSTLNKSSLQLTRKQNNNNNKNVKISQIEQLSLIPTVNDYIQNTSQSSIIDSSRNICTLGMYFENVGNCSFLKQKSLVTQLNDLNCIAMIGNSVLAVGGRFNPSVEFYMILPNSEHKQCGRLDTKSVSGIKCLLIMKSQEQYRLIIGLYADAAHILSYDVQILNDGMGIQIKCIPSISFQKADFDSSSAVVCLRELYNGDYFVAGFTTGSVATYSKNRSEPVHLTKHLYDGAVQGICIIESGKQYLSWCGDRCRFHYITKIQSSQFDASLQNLSALKLLPQNTYSIQMTQSLVDEDRNQLQLTHLLCGEAKEQQYQRSETRESGLRFIRLMYDETKLTLIEEGACSNFHDSNNNSVKEILLIEPRKLMSKIWIVAVGAQNKLQLWEVRRAMSQHINVWEKDLQDFLKPINTNIIKCKLVGESREISSLKYLDAGPRLQIVEVKENLNSGRFHITICMINHESKSEVDFYHIEIMSF